MTIWKTIEGFPNYEISHTGIVRSKVTGYVKKQTVSGTGEYPAVHLNKNGRTHRRFIHRMLAIAFIPNQRNPLYFNIVHHKDGNKKNYALDNLEWVSHKENVNKDLVCGKCGNKHKNGMC